MHRLGKRCSCNAVSIARGQVRGSIAVQISQQQPAAQSSELGSGNRGPHPDSECRSHRGQFSKTRPVLIPSQMQTWGPRERPLKSQREIRAVHARRPCWSPPRTAGALSPHMDYLRLGTWREPPRPLHPWWKGVGRGPFLRREFSRMPRPNLKFNFNVPSKQHGQGSPPKPQRTSPAEKTAQRRHLSVHTA